MHRYFFFVICSFFLFACERNLVGPSSGPELHIVKATQLDHPLTRVVFVDDHNGWALCDSGGVYHTSDGGDSWQFQPVNSESRFMDICFVNAQSGWICGYNKAVFHTTDAGQTWQDQSVPSAADSTFQHVEFINEHDGWLFTAWGYIYRTHDGGDHWNMINKMQRSGIGYFRMWGENGMASHFKRTMAVHRGTSSTRRRSEWGRCFSLIRIMDGSYKRSRPIHEACHPIKPVRFFMQKMAVSTGSSFRYYRRTHMPFTSFLSMIAMDGL